MATVPTTIQLVDGTEVSAEGAICESCHEPLSGHACKNGSTTVTVSRGGAGIARKPVSAHPTCPHCGGRVHFNMSGTAINAECLVRQYALDNGLMTDPNGRLPVLTLDMMEAIAKWGYSLSKPPTYGKMESAAGGAATYSGLRPKTGRKKKAVAASEGEKIEDIAASVEVEVPAPKSKKGRKAMSGVTASTETTPNTTLSVTEEASAVAEAEEIVTKPKRSRPTKIKSVDEIVAAPEEAQAVFVEEENTGGDAPVDAEVVAEVEDRKAKRERERAERRKALLASRR